MLSSWVLSRFRTALLTQNLALLVLRLLRESSLSEWEVLSRLHARYGLDPSAREFARVEKELLGDGFARVESGSDCSKLEITTSGCHLLRRLEREQHEIAKSMVQPHRGGPTYLSR